MLRKIYYIIISLFVFFSAQGQTASSDSLMINFKTYYKASEIEEIHSMFSDEMKKALILNDTKKLIDNIKIQLGNIRSSKYSTTEGEIICYRLIFDRPVVDLIIAFRAGQIVGISKATHNEKKITSNPEDNISVKTPYGDVFGTLAIPQSADSSKFPVVLFIGGSGPTDRNMNQKVQLKTNAFKLLADGLAANGIASVRYDKRGIGKSSSSQLISTVVLEDFVNDAESFIDTLKKDRRFSKVIVLGHSEGATIGLIAALNNTPNAFISLSGAASSLDIILRKQLAAVLTSSDYKIAVGIVDNLKRGKTIQTHIPLSLSPIFNANVQNFLISSMKYNPSKMIAKLHVPTLIVGGSEDIQVSPDEAKQLHSAQKNAELYIINGMNHVLKDVGANKEANKNSYFDLNIPLHKDLVPLLLNFIIGLP